MKILFVTQLTHRGGVDTFVSGLLSGWHSRNQTDQLIFRTNAKHPGLLAHMDVLRGVADVAGLSFKLYTDDLIAPGRLAASLPVRAGLRIIRSIGVSHGFRALFKRLAPERLVWIAGGYPGGDSLLGAFKAWNDLGLGPQPILNVHNLAVPLTGMRGRWGSWVDQQLGAETGLIVAVSRACAESFRQRPKLWARTPVTFVYNGVNPVSGIETRDTPRASIRAQLGLAARAPVCLMLATYEPRKGHVFLFDAFRQVVKAKPDAHLLVCGYGDAADMARVSAECARRGLTAHVTLWGFREDRDALLLAADVLMVPSQAFESFGLVCAEAFSAGLPVVATNIGGLSEVVADGAGGYSVPPDDAAAFADRVVRLLVSPQLRSSQGAMGRARYETIFSLEKMVNFYAEIVRSNDPAKAALHFGNGLVNR